MSRTHCGICDRESPEHPIFSKGGVWKVPHKPDCPYAWAAAYRTALLAIAKDARGAKGKATKALEYDGREDAA